jgi:activator of 2-hydroxyglutaryl-CoA dehydratase
MGLEKEMIFLGGVARNIGVRKYLEEYLKVQFVQIKEDPQIAGALGAAILAQKHYDNGGK